MAKRKVEPKFDAKFSIQMNDHYIAGRKAVGVWVFTCPDWPELAAKYDGVADCSEAVELFTRRFLLGQPVTL